MTLEQFFNEHKKVAIALSGGVDSVYLMHMAKKLGADVSCYFAKTEFQPECELSDAQYEAGRAGVPLCVMSFSALEDENVVCNKSDRCYHCKRGIMQIIKAMAASDGYDMVCDGTNASDDIEDRPGYRALSELGIMSPLALCGITKEEIREGARADGISVADKPSYACLATRIAKGEEITREKLLRIEESEEFLKKLGFSDFRVRTNGDSARLELCSSDFEKMLDGRREICRELRKYFDSVTADLEARDEKLTD